MSLKTQTNLSKCMTSKTIASLNGLRPLPAHGSFVRLSLILIAFFPGKFYDKWKILDQDSLHQYMALSSSICQNHL